MGQQFDGWVSVQGSGEARLFGGTAEQGVNLPPSLTLGDAGGTPGVEIADAAGGRVSLRRGGAEGIRLDANPTGVFASPTISVYFGQVETIRLQGPSIRVRNPASGTDMIHLEGTTGSISLQGTDGREYVRLSAGPKGITLLDSNGNDAITMGTFGNTLILGTQNNGGGQLIVRDDAGKDAIILHGPSGDIILEASDCAEEFDVAPSEVQEPGTVMVLGDEGELRQSGRAYDKRVAGVVSGAGRYKPGIVLGRTTSQKVRVPLALAGKAYCKADARYSPIDIGDLLTTSETPGHAMKVEDPLQAFGAVIGKALGPMGAGQGLIPILVGLQ